MMDAEEVIDTLVERGLQEDAVGYLAVNYIICSGRLKAFLAELEPHLRPVEAVTVIPMRSRDD
jgi:hypothetical protein